MPLGANILRAADGDPSKTDITLITHVNPGGFAQTHFGAMVTNRLSTDSPRQFLMKLNSVAHRPTTSPPKKAAERKRAGTSSPPWRLGLTAAIAVFSILNRGGPPAPASG